MKTVALLFACVVLLAGCSSGVVATGPNTYMVTARVAGIVQGSAAKAKVYREANEWCAKRGLVMVPLTIEAHDTVPFGTPANAELTFRAVKPGAAELQREPTR